MTTYTYYLSDASHASLSGFKKLVTSGQVDGSVTADYGSVQVRLVVYDTSGNVIAYTTWQSVSTTNTSYTAVSVSWSWSYTAASGNYLGAEIQYTSSGTTYTIKFATASTVTYGIAGTQSITIYLRYRTISDPTGGTIELQDIAWGATYPSKTVFTEYVPPPVSKTYYWDVTSGDSLSFTTGVNYSYSWRLSGNSELLSGSNVRFAFSLYGKSSALSGVGARYDFSITSVGDTVVGRSIRYDFSVSSSVSLYVPSILEYGFSLTSLSDVSASDRGKYVFSMSGVGEITSITELKYVFDVLSNAEITEFTPIYIFTVVSNAEIQQEELLTYLFSLTPGSTCLASGSLMGCGRILLAPSPSGLVYWHKFTVKKNADVQAQQQ